MEPPAVTKTIEIYTTPFCPFCLRAKELLKRKRVAFKEIDLYAEPEKRAEMMARARGRGTVPQIFVDGEHVGDCDGIIALDRQGALDAILGIAA
jgi:glutaredoxin 3